MGLFGWLFGKSEKQVEDDPEPVVEKELQSPERVQCPSCGEKNSARSPKCLHCGAPLADNKKSDKPSKKVTSTGRSTAAGQTGNKEGDKPSKKIPPREAKFRGDPLHAGRPLSEWLQLILGGYFDAANPAFETTCSPTFLNALVEALTEEIGNDHARSALKLRLCQRASEAVPRLLAIIDDFALPHPQRSNAMQVLYAICTKEQSPMILTRLIGWIDKYEALPDSTSVLLPILAIGDVIGNAGPRDAGVVEQAVRVIISKYNQPGFRCRKWVIQALVRMHKLGRHGDGGIKLLSGEVKALIMNTLNAAERDWDEDVRAEARKLRSS